MNPAPSSESTATKPDAALEAAIDALLTNIVLDGPEAIDRAALLALGQRAAKAGYVALSEEAHRIAARAAHLEANPEQAGTAREDLGSRIGALKLHLPGACPATAQAPATSPSPATAAPAFGQDSELLQDFIVEAREHLTVIETQLLALENDPANFEVMHAIFRAFHTMKGMAGFLELERVQIVAHEVETLLDLARNGKLAISSSIVDVVLESADFLRVQVDGVEGGLAGRTYDPGPEPAALLDRIRRAAAGEAGSTPEPISPSAPERSAAAVVRTPQVEVPPGHMSAQAVVPSRRLGQDEALSLTDRRQNSATDRRAEGQEDQRTEPRGEARADQRGEQRGERPAPEKQQDASSVRVETGKLDNLLNMIGEMVIAQSLVRHHPSMEGTKDATLSGNLLLLARITGEVQHATMALRMIPIGTLFQRSARVVRDLARKAGKDVVLQMAGEDTELDKKIAEELSDPLLHMIRNALDHGIETPSERLATGKPAQATLRLAAYHQSGQVVVEISDDGRGLDREKILKKAVQNHLLQEHQASQLPDEEVFLLIFEPGFSTAEKITDISGRGVGMDVVRKQVQKLHGRIEIKSSPGQGTQFLLKLPLTLAIIDALVVVVGAQRYLVPIASVRQIFRPRAEMLSTVHGKSEMVLFQDQLLPVVRLHQRFTIAPRSEDPCESLLIVTESGGKNFCLLVDDLLGRQEVVIKGLGEMFKSVSGVSSCAILGDGKVGLILDMEGIFAST